MGRHHRAVKSEVDRRIAAIHHGLGTPCGRARGKTQRVRPGLCQGRSTEEDDDSRDGRTIHRRPLTRTLNSGVESLHMSGKR